MAFDISVFLQFFFSVVFLCVCCLVLMLYMHKFLAVPVQFFLQYCVLPSSTRVRVGGLLISPLNARVFIKDFTYRDENMSLRFVDGYVSFMFWDAWLKDSKWMFVRDFMVTDSLEGMQCRVQVKLRWVRGVIVDVLREEKKIRVRIEGHDAMDGEDEVHELDTPCNVAENENPSKPQLGTNDTNTTAPGTRAASVADARNTVSGGTSLPDESSRLFSPTEGDDRAEARDAVHSTLNRHAETDQNEERGAEATEEDSIKVFDTNVVQIRQNRGRVMIHLNGMGLCLYNATANYKNLSPQQGQEQSSQNSQHRASVHRWAVRNIVSRMFPQDATEGTGEDIELNSNGNEFPDALRGEALETQRRFKRTRNLLQRFYDFIGAVEVELYSSYIDIGGAGAKHPYFLHIGFKRGEAHSYLTEDGLPSVDLHRFVTELTLENVNARWSCMQKEEKPLIVQDEETDAWRESIVLNFNASQPNTAEETVPPKDFKSPNLIRDYGIILGENGKEEASLHLVFYRDAANVYAGENVSDRTQLPRMGFEVLVDASMLCYGPWSHFSLMQIKDFFLPQTHRSLEPLKFELGQPRPIAGFEVFVEFLRDTNVCVPFKRKTLAPTPPFGICDSGRKGVVIFTLGKGSQYIQKPSFILNGEEKQVYESLLFGKNVCVATNGVREKSTILARAETMELFIDRQDSKNYYGRRLWNILPKLHSAEVWWYMDYISFFLDLFSDWQYVPEMYHGVPLTTEKANTYEKFVSQFFPVVRRFEVFIDGSTVLHVNANAENIIFTGDANDPSRNVFLTLSTNSPGYFFMTFPSDSYLLSVYTEVNRPFKLALQNINARISLPHTHPLFELVNPDISFAELEVLEINGSFTVNTPNQTVPQSKAPMGSVSEEETLTNYLSINIRLDGLEGLVTAVHIRTFIDVFNNLFGSSPCVLVLEELSWPPYRAKTQDGIPKNVRQRFNDFLQKDQPQTNRLELDLTLEIDNIDATLQADTKGIAALNLTCGQFNLALIQQKAVNDLSITLSPIAARFYDKDGVKLVPQSNICCGDTAISMIDHFGPLPFRPLFHGSTDVNIGKISFEVTIEQLTMLTRLFEVFLKQFVTRDSGLLSKVGNAQRTTSHSNDYSRNSDDVSSSVSKNFSRGETSGQRFFRSRDAFATAPQETAFGAAAGSFKSTAAADMQETLDRCKACCGSYNGNAFPSETVPETVILDFLKFLDEVELSNDVSKDYAVKSMLVSVDSVSGCAQVGEKGYFALGIPKGVQIATSTLNDLNSMSRLSASIQNVALRGFCRQEDDSKQASSSNSDFLEVFCVETAFCVRQYAAYPFDKGLEFHIVKQANFVKENNVENLFACNFRFPLHQRLPTPAFTTYTFSEPNTTPRYEGIPGGGPEETAIPHARPSVPQPESADGQTELSLSITQEQQQPLRLNMEEGIQETELGLESVTSQPLALPMNKTLAGEPDAVLRFEENVARFDAERREGMKESSTSSLRRPDFFTVATQNNNTSNIYHTCFSGTGALLSAEGDSGEGKTDEEKEGELCGDESCLSTADLDSYQFEPPSLLEGGVEGDMHAVPTNAYPNHGIRPKERFERFLRSYFLLHAKDDDLTLLGYNAKPRSESRIRTRNCASIYAPIPSVQFFASINPHQAPQFLIGKQMIEADAVVPDENVWALRAADNTKRVREGKTSRQIHIETIAPVTVLVTEQFVRSLYFEVESLIQDTQRRLHSASFLSRESPDACSRKTAEEKFLNTSSNNPMKILSQRPGIHNKEPSRSRIHQKRWLSEVKIISVIVPCVEVKVLTSLPVPLQNVPSGAEPIEGVYTTTIGMRSLQFVLEQTFPPLHVARRKEMRSHSASLTFSSIALITQVEFEPLPRDGNLSIKIPGIAYDEEKDTIGIAYVSSLCCRCHLSVTRGMENGACHVTMDTVALHLTRDFFEYLQSMKAMLLRLRSARMESSKGDLGFVFSDPQQLPELINYLPDASERSNGEVNDNNTLHSHNLAVDGRRVIQGVGSIAVVRIELINVTRKGRCLRLDTECTNFLEILKPSAKFLSKIPTRRKVPNSSTSLSLSPRRSLSLPPQAPETSLERQASIQFIGEVKLLCVRCFPSLLNVIGAAKSKVSAYGADGRANTSISRLLGDLLRPPKKIDERIDVLYVYKGSLTLHELDVSLMHSTRNYLQVRAENMTGCGESRTDNVSSRECVQTHVLTGAISERIRRKLRHWAKSARARASNSQFPAPPSVTAQLLLKRSASFFAQRLFMQYVVEPLGSAQKKMDQQVTVLSARATDVAIGMHQADQNKPPKEMHPSMSCESVAQTRTQMNVQLEIRGVCVNCPYYPHAGDTVYPQIHQWMHGWLEARRLFHAVRPAPLAQTKSSFSDLPTPTRALRAYSCAMQVREMNVDLGLPKDIHLILNMPLFSALMTASSEQRLNVKAHLHPFALTSFGPTDIRQTVEMPSVYLIYAQDETRRTGTCFMEVVEITVSPSIIGHVILTCDMFLVLREVLSHPIYMDVENDAPVSQNLSSSHASDYGSWASPSEYPFSPKDEEQGKPPERGNAPSLSEFPITQRAKVQETRFAFLLKGLRTSYLTSVTNLRYSLRRLNALTNVSLLKERRRTEVLLNVVNAQVALVDRDDHDKQQAALQSQRRVCSDSSLPSTRPAAGAAAQPFASPKTEDSLRAFQPLGGFVWGLIETSFTLSREEMKDFGELRATTETLNPTTSSPLVDEQEVRELESTISNAAHWNLSFLSPMAILRVGLVPLLQRCIDETKELTKRFQFVSDRENLALRRRLLNAQEQKRNAHKKSPVGLETESSQEGLPKTLSKTTSQVTNTNKFLTGRQEYFFPPPTMTSVSNNSKNNETGVNDEEGDPNPLLLVLENNLSITVSKFLVVIPFGDAAYRSILEGESDVFINTASRSDRRGFKSPLNRSRFIPTMALKTSMEFATVTCGIRNSRNYVPVTPSPLSVTNRVNAFAEYALPKVQATADKLNVTARIAVKDVNTYFSDGSPLSVEATAAGLLHNTQVLGGLGTLTASNKAECRKSASKMFCKSIEIPLSITKRGAHVRIGALIDADAPVVTISTRFVSTLSQFMHELPSQVLPPFSITNGPVSSLIERSLSTERHSQTSERHVDPMEPNPSPLPPLSQKQKQLNLRPQSPIQEQTRFHFDLTARLDGGEMLICSMQKEPSNIPPSSTDGVHSKSRTQWRRVVFSPEIGGDTGRRSESRMSVLLKLPIPDALLTATGTLGGSEDEDEEMVINLEVRASTMRVGPSITLLAREIEEWGTVHNRDINERVTKIMELVQEWESDVNVYKLTVQTLTVADIALPLPRSFAEKLRSLRKPPSSGYNVNQTSLNDSVSVVGQRSADRKGASPTAESGLGTPIVHLVQRFSKSKKRAEGETGTQGARRQRTPPAGSNCASVLADSRRKKVVKNSFRSFHMSVTGFRLILTTDPAASVTLSLFLDERGGGADMFINKVSTSRLSSIPHNSAIQEPVVSFIVNLHGLRAECQARLEVKSLEVYIPTVEVTGALRRKGSHSLVSVCAQLPYNVSGGAELEIKVRAQHVSQLYIVEKLWHKTLLELIHSIRRRFKHVVPAHISTEEAPLNVTPQSCPVRKSYLTACQTSQKSMVHTTTTFIFVLNVLHGRARLDMGSGNAQQASVSCLNIALETRTPFTGAARKVRFDVAARSLALRSEGVLSGVASLENLLLKGFLIENSEGTLNFERSPGKRTFRGVLCAQKFHVSFKERQLNDVVECTAVELTLSVMDGVGEEDSTTVKADFFLNKGNIVLTPNTVPAFVNTIYEFGTIAAAQKAAANEKLELGTPQRSGVSRAHSVRETVGGVASVIDACSTDVPEDVHASTTSGQDSSCRDLPYIPIDETAKPLYAFMGNPLTRIPCGEINVKLEQTTLLVRSVSGSTGGSLAGCLIASLPKAKFAFAECPSEGFSTVKKALVFEAHNMELYRPGALKSLIFGFPGANKFEFYTRQKLNDKEVFFVLTLDQVNPWTGNPRLMDIQEIIQLVRSFTAKGSTELFQRRRKSVDSYEQFWGESTSRVSLQSGRSETAEPASSSNIYSLASPLQTVEPPIPSELLSTGKPFFKDCLVKDERCLKALRSSKFSPQLRFGGDVEVNIDVILNWLGVTEKMLPNILHAQVCDKMERLLSCLSEKVSERVRLPKGS